MLRNKTVEAWEAAGSPPSGSRPGEGEIVSVSPTAGTVHRYEIGTPADDAIGDIDAMSMWAGQGVGLVSRPQPAGEIVREIAEEAREVIRRLAGT